MEAFEKKNFWGGGQNFKSSVVLIIIDSDLRNRMVLSDFENSKYFRSYGQLWPYQQMYKILDPGGGGGCSLYSGLA